MDCEALARLAAKEALSRPPQGLRETDGALAYWTNMILGERYILAYCDADLVELHQPVAREDFLTQEFLAFAEGLVQVVESDRRE